MEGKRRTEEREKKKWRRRIWKSSAHRFSQEIASLFDSLPESVPPIETALQMLLLYADYKEGAFMRRTSILGLSVSELRCSASETQA